MRRAFLTVREVAEQIQMTEDYVTRACNAGTLRATKLGNVWRIKPEWLDDFMEPATAPEPSADEPAEPAKLTGRRAKAAKARAAQQVAS